MNKHQAETDIAQVGRCDAAALPPAFMPDRCFSSSDARADAIFDSGCSSLNGLINLRVLGLVLRQPEADTDSEGAASDTSCDAQVLTPAGGR
jgi:hypothetical protein